MLANIFRNAYYLTAIILAAVVLLNILSLDIGTEQEQRSFFYHYQTLITGMIALTVGAWTVREMRRHTDHAIQSKVDEDKRDVQERLRLIRLALYDHVRAIRNWGDEIKRISRTDPKTGEISTFCSVPPRPVTRPEILEDYDLLSALYGRDLLEARAMLRVIKMLYDCVEQLQMHRNIYETRIDKDGLERLNSALDHVREIFPDAFDGLEY